MNNQKVKREQYITPLGTAKYIYINGREDILTDQFTGRKTPNGYSATIEITEEQANEVKAKLLQAWQQSREYEVLSNNGKKVDEPKMPLFKNKEGAWLLKAKTKPTFYDAKTQSQKERVVMLRDGLQNILDPKTTIWSGSTIRLVTTINPYAGAVGYGISLYLSGIQIAELAEAQGGNSWGTIEGSHAITNFVQPQVVTAKDETEEIPFQETAVDNLYTYTHITKPNQRFKQEEMHSCFFLMREKMLIYQYSYHMETFLSRIYTDLAMLELYNAFKLLT